MFVRLVFNPIMVLNTVLFLALVAGAAANPISVFPVIGTMPLLWILLFSALVYLCFLPRHHFKRTGLKYLTPVPLLGDMSRVIFRRMNVFLNLNRVYEGFPGERFVGLSECIRPAVVIRDLELVKRLAVKEFGHFQDHTLIIDKDIDRVFGRSIFVMKGQDWRDMRSTLSPVFTSLKLKQMMPPMVEVGSRMVNEIRRRVQESKTKHWDLDFNVLASHYNFEIIISCVFGLTIDSQDHRNVELYDMGKMLSQLKYSQLICFLGFQVVPNVMRMLRATMFPQASADFFKKLLVQTLQSREASKIDRHDFVDLILHARRGGNLQGDDKAFGPDAAAKRETTRRVWSDDDLFAQALLLLIAGFDPVSAAVGMLVHELALNPEVQERLVQEIQETDRRTGGKIDYTAIQEMTYMDMVVSELLRKWANSNVDRLCTKDYNLGRPNDSATKDYIIRKGEGLYIPMRSIHFDPQYYPEPFKFDPERFSKENRPKIPPFAYKPFGLGLRMCMGARFANCVIKMLTYQLLRDVEISCYEKTSTNIQLDPSTISLRNKGGSWVRLTLRE